MAQSDFSSLKKKQKISLSITMIPFRNSFIISANQLFSLRSEVKPFEFIETNLSTVSIVDNMINAY